LANETQNAQALVRHIEAFVAGSAQNRLQRLDGSPIFENPLVGMADAYDPLFQEYKTIIGAHHLTPQELLQAEVGEGQTVEAPLRVVAWTLPVSRETRLSNRTQTDGPSERWAHTRTYGEEFNDVLRREVVGWLQGQGYLAVAPLLCGIYKTPYPGLPKGYFARWSERHALYAAGLGTFSLNDGFITSKGMAMRCGTVITNLPLPVTPRTYRDHYANCLHFREGTCGECIQRCPAGALSTQGHDKAKCGAFVYGSGNPARARYDVSAVGCGLCQTGVPCEERIP
jgi:epoxyqueuosine reductase